MNTCISVKLRIREYSDFDTLALKTRILLFRYLDIFWIDETPIIFVYSSISISSVIVLFIEQFVATLAERRICVSCRFVYNVV